MSATKLDVHPLALAIPEMLTDEYLDLKADIKVHGLHEPIVLFEGKILDGRHRYRACTELGIEPTTKVFPGTSDQAKAFVHSLNVERRHLTFEQKRALIVAELKRDPTQSNRTIARKAKVDHKTVAKVRAKANGDDPHNAERKEASGRKARGRKPAEKPKAATIPMATPLLIEPAKPKATQPAVPEMRHQIKRGIDTIRGQLNGAFKQLRLWGATPDELQAVIAAIRRVCDEQISKTDHKGDRYVPTPVEKAALDEMKTALNGMFRSPKTPRRSARKSSNSARDNAPQHAADAAGSETPSTSAATPSGPPGGAQ